jgi:hypothetical protein
MLGKREDEQLAVEGTMNELLTLRVNMTNDEVRHVLRANALTAHQLSVGRGDTLITFLERTVKRIEGSQKRIELLNTVFFFFGLGMIGTGVYVALFGGAGGEVWGSMLGVGGLASAVSMFYTAPMDRIAQSVRDLIQLETAFLGYIRVIGEIDSGFQWHYIETMDSKGTSGNTDISLRVKSATDQMKEIMGTTMELIEKYTSGDSSAKTQELSKNLEQMKQDFDARLSKLEKLRQP